MNFMMLRHMKASLIPPKAIRGGSRAPGPGENTNRYMVARLVSRLLLYVVVVVRVCVCVSV